ncbi:MAG: sigma-54 interaction domain-containing protein, partial [Litorivicinaceae bacterium]
MTQGNMNRLLGIADPSWPTTSPIETRAIELGYEAMVSSEPTGLRSRSLEFGLVVIHLPRGGSIQSIIEAMKHFDDAVQFLVLTDMTDEQSVKTLERIPGVSVNSVADIASIAWDELFQQFLVPTVDDRVDEESHPGAQYVFVDPKSQHLLALIERLAVTKAAVLLQGQTGTGKEIVARTLHALSDRASAPFVALNCAAMPEHLVEDMLFGHEKGAFTGAARELQGIFEQAKNGTVFLDEIGEMPVQLQAKLLRVLQEKEVVRLGGRDPIALDFRLIAATNKDLKAGIADKTFREDLYYRISAFKLQIPSLMDRKGDILPLANTLAARHGLEHPEFTEAALRQLYRYSWPGNVRELDNVIQRAVVFANYGRIDEQHIFFDE